MRKNKEMSKLMHDMMVCRDINECSALCGNIRHMASEIVEERNREKLKRKFKVINGGES